ncbi:hypothetical protein [Nocardia sp. CA-290969]|uniref:hypothetical protein n=1 Tax=Nocardia sp. CA-290969 TaxID=3239986 RepID=UPI003D8B424F
MYLFASSEETRNWADTTDAREPFRPPGGPGIAEVKPHTDTGIRQGLAQLRSYRYGDGKKPPLFAGGVQLLVTYVPIDASGKPVRRGRAAAVRVYARSVTWPPRERSGPVVLGPLQQAGTRRLPEVLPFPRVDESGYFGHAVEKFVRGHLHRISGRPAVRGYGGPRSGPDIVWKELAALYGELARATGDPAFAQLATELATRP